MFMYDFSVLKSKNKGINLLTSSSLSPSELEPEVLD